MSMIDKAVSISGGYSSMKHLEMWATKGEHTGPQNGKGTLTSTI